MRRHPLVLLLLLLCGALWGATAEVDRYADLTRSSATDGKVVFYFIDLDVPKDSPDKSGDATLVVAPDGATMLIDCGHPASGRDVVDLLHALGLTRIDVFVNSHPHIDHLGAFPEVADAVDIGQVFRTRLEYHTRYTRAFADTVEKKRIPLGYLADGDAFDLGGQVHVEVLGPAQGDINPPPGQLDTACINNSSMVLRITYGDSVALFAGDLYRSGEQEVLEKHPDKLKADLAKADHHGIDTSNILPWVKAVRPTVVVAMNDVMGSMSVYKSYLKRGATFYHTNFNGLVKVEMGKNHDLAVETQYDSWVEKGGQQ
ncbi:MAG: MBL fold metallo-hydrolase [Spirochaetaceae bacterium]|jgi:competence protein ComEC|nr:MBL fold metallo-hydrolase [Spirochaetaceae bacterium]